MRAMECPAPEMKDSRPQRVHVKTGSTNGAGYPVQRRERQPRPRMQIVVDARETVSSKPPSKQMISVRQFPDVSRGNAVVRIECRNSGPRDLSFGRSSDTLSAMPRKW